MARRVSGEVVIRINDAEVKNSITGMGKEIRRLKKEINDLEVTDKDYQKNLKRLTGELDVAKKKYGEFKDGVKAVGSETSKLPGILKGIGPMIAATFSVAAILEFGRVLRQNVDVAQRLKKEMAQITGQTGSQLNENTSSVLALADTYEEDASRIVQTTNALSKQLKIPFETAFAVIKEGFESGANASGEFLDNIREYAPFMNEAKISASEMVKIIETGAKEGIYSDKAIDAVKEFTLRMREGTKSTREAIAGLGIDVDDLYNKIETGQTSYWDALRLVSEKLEEVGGQSTIAGTAIADIFGGPGEDAGYKYLSMLHEIGEETKKLSAEAEEDVKIKQRQFEANKKLNDIWVSLTGSGSKLTAIWVEAKVVFAELLQLIVRGSKYYMEFRGISNSMNSIWKSTQLTFRAVVSIFRDLKNSIQALAESFGISGRSSEEFLKKIEQLLNPLTYIQGAISNTAKGMRLFANTVRMTVNTVGALAMTIRDLINVFSQLDISSPIESLNRLRNFSFSESFKENRVELEIGFNERKARAEMKKTLKGMFDEHEKILAERASQGDETFTLGFNASKIREEAEKARKEAEKAAEAERKRREQIQKEIEQSEKQFYDNLLKQQRSAQDAELELMNEGFAKEKKKIDTEFQRKIEDLRNQIAETQKYQSELREKSAAEYKVGNVAGGDGFKKLADDQVEIINEINETIEALEKTHLINLAKLRFDFDKKELEERERAIERELMNLETRHNNELKAVTNLEEAKKVLRDQYGFSEDELQKLRSFEKAKEEIVLSQQKETLNKQLELLKEFQDKLKGLIDAEVAKDAVGIPGLYSAEELDEMIAKYETLGNVISNLGKSDEEEDVDADAKKQLLSGIDLLGFTAEDWTMAFDSLDQAETKLQKLAAVSNLVRMGFDSMTNALGMFYDAQNQKIQNDLKVYEAAINRKKSSLAKQLEEGYISQETYNAKIAKLEADLEKKRAEAEYKQAMNEWKMQMVQAVGSMALGILNSLSYGGPVGIAFAAITAALGAFQISTLASAKPKKPSGYFAGGPTGGSGVYDDYGRELADGPVHANEYVIPEYLRQDPVIARMEEFIEARRRGMNPNIGRPEDGYADGGVTRPAPEAAAKPQENDYTTALLSALNRLNDNLEYMQENPLEAKLSRTLETAKVLLDDQEEYKNHRNKNKR